MRKTFAAFVLALLLAVPTLAERGVKPSAVDTLAQDAMRKQNLPAITVAVVDRGRIVYSRAFGLTDLENGVPATPDSEIRTASIAKPMTAVAAMQLARDGQLDLDAPVQKYCPAYSDKTSPDGKPWVVTTRQLLEHRAGERWYRDDTEQKNAVHYASIDEAVRHFGSEPLQFEPGTKFQYSTYGYVVVGCVIEGAAHAPFLEYMRRAIFAPAGMTETLPDNPVSIIPHRARAYQKTKEDKLENAPWFDPSDRLSGGGWLSTAQDLIRFAAAVMSGKLVSPVQLEEMWKPATVQDNGSGYGLGWEITQLSGLRVVGHNGGQVGSSTSLKLVPGRDLAIAVMTNIEGASLDETANAILSLYLRASRPTPTGFPK